MGSVYTVQAIFEAVDNITGTVQGIEGNLANLGQSMQQVGGSMQKAGTAATAGLTVPLTLAGKSSVDVALSAERLENTLVGLAGGAEQAASYVDAIQEASGGTISKVDALAIANKALSMGVVQSADEMANLTTMSIALGRAQGLTSTEAADTLTMALARQSRLRLDDLGIIMDQAEANAYYADILGKDVSALTDAEKAEAFRALAIAKGMALTEEMGGVQDDTAASVERFHAMLSDLGIMVGNVLLPPLEWLMTNILTPLVTWFSELDSGTMKWIVALGGLIAIIGPILVIGGTLIATLGAIIGALGTLAAAVGMTLLPFLAVLLAVLGSLVLMVLLPLLILIGEIALVVYALKTAWESNFLGIRDITQGVVEGIKGIIESYLMPIFAIVVDFINTAIVPAFNLLAQIGQIVLGTAISVLSAIWQTILLPIIQIVYNFIQGSIVPLWNALATLTTAVLGKAVEILSALWQNVLKPAIEDVWDAISGKLLPIFRTVADFIKVTVKPILENLANVILPPIRGAFDAIAGAVGGVIDKIGTLTDRISGMELPPWLQPGSPPPLYHALMDVARAMDTVASHSGFADLMGKTVAVAGSASFGTAGGAAGGNVTTNTRNDTTHLTVVSTGLGGILSTASQQAG